MFVVREEEKAEISSSAFSMTRNRLRGSARKGVRSTMTLGIGIVGLPNVGKSTLFNALSQTQAAQAANYPFCTIEPNHAIVPVPDARLDALARIANPEQVLPATVEFVDIAGLVQGASQGEGLGNKFLANVREAAALLHVVRGFEDDDITHVEGSVDPIRDLDVIETELLLADVQSVESRIDKQARKAKGDKSAAAELETLHRLLDHLSAEKPASAFVAPTAADADTIAELSLLSAKAVIYCVNVDEGGLAEDSAAVAAIRQRAQALGRPIVVIAAKVEEELVGLEGEDRADFLGAYGIQCSGVEQVIRAGYETLGLVSYFTAGPKEVRAWTIRSGWTAPQAAGVIHTDFERGFIRAEVVAFDAYVDGEGEAGARAAGALRSEGKEYVVNDGDVVHFRFNV